MKEGNRLKAQERLNDSNAYKAMEQVQKLMDTYYLDGVIGLLPFGIGDILAALFAVLYVWFAVAKVRSIPLSLAIINNSLFHKANRQNMELVRGFVEGDKDVIRDVNRKAIQSALLIVLMVVIIIAMMVLVVSLTGWIWHNIILLFNR